MIIPLIKPYRVLREELYLFIEAALYSGYIAEDETAWEFEDGLKEFFGNSNVLAVQTGTDAMHLVLFSLNIGPGDEVISIPMTLELTNTINTITATKVV